MSYMENKTLDHLLKIEAEASALVNDAKTEADRRIRENEEKNRMAYEERFKEEAQKREASLKEEKDRLKNQYQEILEKYREELSGVNADEQRFLSLFNQYVAAEG